MTLSAGTRLGPYEITSTLGAGGMGEVYRARDTRLERTVAIKVLPSHLSENAEVRQRFEREAKTISSLSHPHICALYDVGHQDGTDYLVMEFLEGETLTDRLAKGPFPTEQVLRHGIEIADALDKAHRQGIVHRDLKPGNVMLTSAGVKLVDFGLAKLAAPVSPVSGLSMLPTQAGANLTQEGTILGTFQYMAPEQLEGKDADARTDIFAFGAVLYEMVTGKKAFSGTSQASLISAIMKEEPAPISAVQPMTPPVLDRVVKTCLAKDPEDRWQSAGDVAKELKWIAEGSAAGLAAPAAVTSRRRNRERLAWGMAAVAVAAAATAFAVFWLRPPRPPLPLRKLEIPAPQLNVGIGQPLRLSPDGARVAYVAGGRLWIRELAQLEAREVPGSEGAVDPFWSPDGAYLGFAAQSKLWKYPVAGGDRTSIADLPAALSPAAGIDWGSDDRIVFTTGFSGLIEVPAQGGRPTALLDAVPKTEADFHQPSLLPGGRGVLFVVHRVPQGLDTIDVFTGKTRKTLVPLPGERLSSPVYAATGHLIFVRARASGFWAASGVWAVPFSLSKLEVTGAPFLVAQDSAFPSVASDGTLALLPQTGLPRTQLVWVDRGGADRRDTRRACGAVCGPRDLSRRKPCRDSRGRGREDGRLDPGRGARVPKPADLRGHKRYLPRGLVAVWRPPRPSDGP